MEISVSFVVLVRAAVRPMSVLLFLKPYRDGIGVSSQLLSLREGFDIFMHCLKRFVNELADRQIRSDAIVVCLAKGHQCLAVGDKKGIVRYGTCILPMDESLVLCSLDLSGRPYYVSDAEFPTERVGEMDTQMVKEFFYAVSYSAGMNLHFKMLSGGNSHHMIEGMFKAFAKALDMAVAKDPRITDVLSTKGSL